MSFFQGLLTGTATSLSGNLQSALDRRENEMSRARAYMRTRQAQKEDLADAHDRRASKALDRFINEFDGNVAKGLAAYKAVGGSVDAAEAYIKELDGTRAVGIDYNIMDKFKFDNIDMEQFADLSRTEALGSIRQEVSPVSAGVFKDTSGLGKIGLGLRDTSKYADEINKLIPPRVNKAVEGLESATFDPTGTKSATQFQMEKQKFESQMKNSSLDIKNQVKFNILELNKLTDSPEDETKKLELLKDNEALIKTYDTFSAIDNRGKGGVTTSGLLSLYSSRMTALKDNSQYGTVGNQASIVDNSGKVLTGQDATTYYNKIKADAETQYVEQVLMNPDGTYRSARAEDMVSFLGITQEIIDQATANINERMNNTRGNTGADSKAPVVDTTEPKNDSTSSVAETTDLYKETRTDNKPDSNIESTAEDLSFFNSGMSVGTQGTVIKGRNAEEFGANLLQYVADNPKDYIEGLSKEYGNDYIVENINDYKIYLDTAADLIKDEERKEEYKRQVKETIDNLPKKMTSIMRSLNAQSVLQMPEDYMPIKAQKLLSDEGGFMGNYLYEDANGMQYISPQLPSKFGIEVK